MPGPPPTPTALRKLKGNPGRRPLNEREPKQSPGDVRPPSWLSAKAKNLWRELQPVLDDMGVLTVADRQALTLLCDAYVEWREAREIVRREGASYETYTMNGGLMIRQRPEVGIAAEAWKRAKSMMMEFGLSPASRSRINTSEVQEEVDPFEELMNGTRQN